jgi:excisionase family DNA binding protein
MAKKSPAHTLDLHPNQRYDVDEACAYLRISRAYLFSLIRSGAIQVLKDGRRTYIPGTELIARSRLPETTS